MIRPRAGSYAVAVYDPGLKRKRWVGTFKTMREAREAEREAGRRRSVGGRVTCGEYVRLWLAEYRRPAPATQRTYRYALQQFAEDFERRRLGDFDRLTARAWANSHPQSNVRVARAMFNDAINDGLHPGPNPFANLRLEQSRGRKDLIALKEDELRELADVAVRVLGDYGRTFRAMILFAAYVGLRPGELFALERGDLAVDEVHIRRNLDGTGQLKLPKNGKQRIVILPPPARDALLDVPPRIDVPWLFVTGRGRRFQKSSLLYYWNRCGRRSAGRGWTSTSCATSARRTCSSWACHTPTSRCSSGTRTAARSSCRPTGTRLRTERASG